MRRRVIVIGIDGASWNILNKGISKGKLPLFKFLVKNSINGTLKSTIPPISPSAWNSIYSGAHPTTNGIINFFEFDEKEYLYTFSKKKRKIPTIFKILSIYNRKVFGVNLPFYWPPEHVTGSLIPGFGSPKIQIYPKEFEFELRSIIPDFCGDVDDYGVMLDRDGGARRKNKKDFERRKKIFIETQELIRYFLNRDFDFGFFVFRAHEPLKHFYYYDIDHILDFYHIIDKTLQEIVKNMSTDDVLLVVSDHGFREIKSYVNLNNFLESIGLFRCKQKRQIPLLDIIGRILFRIHPRLIKNILSNPYIWNIIKRIPNRTISYLNSVDWNNTKAFYLEGSEGIIRVNLDGREGKGCVSSKEYENIRNKIILSLRSLKDPSGKKVVKDVIRIEDIYGKDGKKYGDLIVIPNEGYAFCGGYNTNKSIFDYERGRRRPGEHDVNGIFIIYSKNQKLINTKKGEDVASVIDIAPTILSLFNIPIPEFMDGKPILKAELNKTISEKLKLSFKIGKLKNSGKLIW